MDRPSYAYAEATEVGYPTSKAAPMPDPESPRMLNELSDAARVYAEACNIYIHARRGWREARERYQHLAGQTATVIEKEEV